MQEVRQELRKCHDLANQAKPTNRTVLAEDWHIQTMLMRSADDQDIRERAYRLLDPMLADQLLASLRAYLDCHANIMRTAHMLFVHPNTVKYRLRKIERLTGLTGSHLPNLIELQLALTLHDIDPDRFAAEAGEQSTNGRR